jgi:RNA polymerase sigma-70 factor (ECF subfamily)
VSGGAADPALVQLLEELRPRLHRYCARMTGSVLDGEDVLQDAIVKTLEAFPGFDALDNPQGWVFRVTHRAALDFLRARARRARTLSEENVMAMPDQPLDLDARMAAASSLAMFMRLSVSQRSSVVLMDVLGHTLEEIAAMTGASLAAVKSSLHRGRARLRELVAASDAAPALEVHDSALLAAYAERFNARDFEAVRDMLAEEVRFEIVARTTLRGRAAVAGAYFGNYAAATDWRFTSGLVEGRPALLVHDPSAPEICRYFIMLEWRNGQVVAARDFRHARYIVEGAEMTVLGPRQTSRAARPASAP